MVHNGIEYGDMQLICEAYAMLKHAAGLSNDQLYDVFAQWNRGELQSYLIEITRDIFSVRDELADGYLVDMILDRGRRKGHGQVDEPGRVGPGHAQHAGDDGRLRALLVGPEGRPRAGQPGAVRTGRDRHTNAVALIGDRTAFIEKVRQALYASKIVSYAQGFVQLQAAAKEYEWPLDYGLCARLWRGGCIIRAQFLERIMEAFAAEPQPAEPAAVPLLPGRGRGGGCGVARCAW